MDLEDAEVRIPPGLVQVKAADARDHGLRFTNEEWNGSIANGQAFKIRWNDTIEAEHGELRLFRIWYPEDGIVTLEPASNLTEFMVESSCIWTPKNLDQDELYTIWVSNEENGDKQWAISPPWKPKDPKDKPTGLHWRNSIGIPIVVILGIYFLCLGTCLLYRRRRNRKRDKERQRKQQLKANATTPAPPDDRHPSVSSVVTVQTYTEEDELVKKDETGTWIVTNPSPSPRQYPSSNGGVQWNRMVWRSDPRMDRGAGSGRWDEAWDDEGPIGQAR